MGMFDKDKKMAKDGYLTEFAPAPELAKDEISSMGTEFILHGALIVDPEWVTPLGTTPMCHLAVSKVDTPDKVYVVSALGKVTANKVESKADGDLPAVCVSQRVKSKESGHQDAYVMTFVRPYKGKEIVMEMPK